MHALERWVVRLGVIGQRLIGCDEVIGLDRFHVESVNMSM